MQRVTTIAATLLSCLSAAGQTASVSVSAPVTTVTPGETLTITVEAQFDTAVAPSGVFGAAGLFGFGGSIAASGTIAATSSASPPLIDAQLGFGPVAQLPADPARYVLGAGGRGFQGGLAGPSRSLMTFDVTIDPAASGGETLELSYEGAVVLVLGDKLVTYSTDPGLNQQTLTTTGLTLTVASERLCSDQNGDGLATPADFNAWILNFNSGDVRADVNQNGSLSPADFNAWILAFNQSASGPICTP
ncbi:MAG: GC-type dockerin domain-anchored protein [Planctomycetota bacterium]